MLTVTTCLSAASSTAIFGIHVFGVTETCRGLFVLKDNREVFTHALAQ